MRRRVLPRCSVGALVSVVVDIHRSKDDLDPAKTQSSPSSSPPFPLIFPVTARAHTCPRRWGVPTRTVLTSDVRCHNETSVYLLFKRHTRRPPHRMIPADLFWACTVFPSMSSKGKQGFSLPQGPDKPNRHKTHDYSTRKSHQGT